LDPCASATTAKNSTFKKESGKSGKWHLPCRAVHPHPAWFGNGFHDCSQNPVFISGNFSLQEISDFSFHFFWNFSLDLFLIPHFGFYLEYCAFPDKKMRIAEKNKPGSPGLAPGSGTLRKKSPGPGKNRLRQNCPQCHHEYNKYEKHHGGSCEIKNQNGDTDSSSCLRQKIKQDEIIC